MVTEFCAGGNLAEMIEAGPLDRRKIVNVSGVLTGW